MVTSNFHGTCFCQQPQDNTPRVLNVLKIMHVCPRGAHGQCAKCGPGGTGWCREQLSGPQMESTCGGGRCDRGQRKAPPVWVSQHEGGGEVTGPARSEAIPAEGRPVCVPEAVWGEEGAHVAQMGDRPLRGSEELPTTGARCPAV